MSYEKIMESSYNSFFSRNILSMRQNWEHNQHSSRNLHQSNKNAERGNTFLVKIPFQQFDREDLLYRWRLTKPQNIVGLADYQIITSTYNRKVIKVTVEPFSCMISQLASINFIKCIQLMKQTLEGIMEMIKRFGIKIIKSNNIVITHEGQAKVWLNENLEINPASFQEQSEHVVCYQLIKIFKEICLQTKLSTQFFREIQQEISLEGILQHAQQFETYHNLFSLTSSRATSSTSLSNSSENLKFSDRTENRKKKKNIVKVQSMPYFSNQLEYDSLFMHPSIKKSEFINEERVQSHYLTANPDGKISLLSPKYSSTTYMTRAHTNAGSGFLSPTTQKAQKSQVTGSKLKNHSSFVISEIYQDDSQEKIEVPDEPKKEKKMKSQIRQKSVRDPNCFGSAQMLHEGWSTNFAFPKVEKINEDYSDEESNKISQGLGESNKISQGLGQSKRLSQMREQTLKSQIVEDQSFFPFEVIARNGWNNDLLGLMNSPALKQSYTIGKEQNSYLKDLNLQKLDRLGRKIMRSFMPVEEEEYSFQA